jgi:hypothetical protein
MRVSRTAAYPVPKRAMQSPSDASTIGSVRLESFSTVQI